MALIVEDGTGSNPLAESYASVADADGYWERRPHDANSTTWLAETDDEMKEGALREASAYLDATYAPLFVGSRSTATQGLQWPRVERSVLDRSEYDTQADFEAAQAETDEPIIGADGLELDALPAQIVAATIELAARAVAAPLAADVSSNGAVKKFRRKVGPIEREWEYFGSPLPDGTYGFVDRLLGPVLIGLRGSSWNWA